MILCIGQHLAKMKYMSHQSRQKADFYTLKAKKEGYPARSVYKLEEILQKNRIIKQGSKILDIGAAPGSWSMYLSKKMQAKITAVDLKPLNLKSMQNIQFFQGDAFSPDTAEKIAGNRPFDAVVSDAAPSTSGNRTVDAGRSYELVYNVIQSCNTYLKKGGSLIVKVFQGGDEKELMELMKSKFQTTKALKPKACRKNSFETFFIGINFSGTKNT